MSWRLRSPKTLMGFWPLQGNARDLSGHARDGTWAGTEAYGTFHKNGLQCGSFNYASNIDVAYSTNLNPSETTVTLWARCDGNAGQFRSPATSRATVPTALGWYFYANNLNKWTFTYSKAPGAWLELAGRAVVLGEWVFLAATAGSSGVNFFINGEFQATDARVFVPNPSKPLRIGAGRTEGGALFYFDGLVAAVQIHNVTLTLDEILKLMHRPLSVL